MDKTFRTHSILWLMCDYSKVTTHIRTSIIWAYSEVIFSGGGVGQSSQKIPMKMSIIKKISNISPLSPVFPFFGKMLPLTPPH